MCEYCKQWEDKTIHGKHIRDYEWRETKCKNEFLTHELDFMEAWIMKCEGDKYAGLMVDNGHSARYININYCPMCGRKLEEE